MRPPTLMRARRAGFAVVCMGSLVGPLDMTVNTAFPVITDAFGLPQRDIQWIVIAYVLAQAAIGLVFGHLGDLFGHRRIFATGLAASAIGHAAVALADSFPVMVWMRVLQGIGVSITLACAPALVTLAFPVAAKSRMLGRYVAIGSAAMALAPWLGGLLLQGFGWPGVFWFRVPIALLALALVPWALADDAPGHVVGTGAGPAARFDWGGAFGLAATLAAGVLGIASIGRPDAPALPLLALALVLLLAFVRHEARHPRPVLRMAPFRAARFSGLQIASVVLNLACFANLLLLPHALTQEIGASIIATGLVLSVAPSGLVLGNLLSARWSARWSAQRVMAVGLACAALGLAATAAVLQHWPAQGPLMLATLLTGIGQGLFNVGYMDATTSMLPPAERGVAGSLVNLTRLLGVVLGASGISLLRDAIGSVALSFAVLSSALAGAALLFHRALHQDSPARSR